ncbi:hypothetical protein PFLUV_G00156790 [Perca fluviatilis]|uniref:Uncharacterized protein n=1 Tax=Perca fluviatilis TaxID=8168 RepID=A0A6A5EGZ8_PERFL|nr:uncharacterized protein LOC120571942 [Perca fluviatilis]KAF1381706.1 hypothetical protein PFLUV_G00156790 [Perca fluviatilis]
MEVPRLKKRPRRRCEHCNTELCHTQYFDHRKRYFKNGVWEKKTERARSDNVQSLLLLSSHDPTGGSYVPSMCKDFEDNFAGVGEIDESEMHSEDPEKELMEESEEMHPATDCSDDNEETAADQSINLFLDSSNSEPVQDDEDISCSVNEYVTEEDEEGESLAFNSPSTPLHGRDQPLSATPQTDEKKLLNAISGLSRQLTVLAANVNEQFTVVNSRLLSIEDRLAALESKNRVEETNPKKRRRVHNPKLAEAVRRLHNSETNCRRYEPEQGLTSPHNEAVTSYLLGAVSASPDLHGVAKDAIVSACKTYYETVRRSFRYKQPDLASQAEAVKSSARSRSRRKRLLEARKSVLAEDEVDLWKCATIDLMSDEEDGIVDGVSGWIVRPPSSRSQELTELCATLQSRLEVIPKYRAMHHRRLQNGPN